MPRQAQASFIAVMAWTVSNRISKYTGFDRQADADRHVSSFADRYPDAFVVSAPVQGDISDWLVNPVGNALTYDPLPPRPPPPPILNVDGLADLLVTKGVVSQAEIDGRKE